MKHLFIATAALEVGAGIALMCSPSATVALLVGSPLDTSAAVALGRLAGVALLALGIASWLAQHDERSGAARGLVNAMVVYNVGAVVVLVSAGLRPAPAGVALWPAVIVHGAMTAWCVASLLRTPISQTPPRS